MRVDLFLISVDLPHLISRTLMRVVRNGYDCCYRYVLDARSRMSESYISNTVPSRDSRVGFSRKRVRVVRNNSIVNVVKMC